MVAAIEELLPVSGSETAFAKAWVGATVVGAGVLFGSVGVAADATGVPATAFEAVESPFVFEALIVTE